MTHESIKKIIYEKMQKCQHAIQQHAVPNETNQISNACGSCLRKILKIRRQFTRLGQIKKENRRLCHIMIGTKDRNDQTGEHPKQ